MVALAIAAAPAISGPPKPAKDACETTIARLEASTAEGEERLAEKNAAIEACASQFRRDTVIGNLVKACARYEEQAVIKQQFVADCQLAAFGYGNALGALKAEYGR